MIKKKSFPLIMVLALGVSLILLGGCKKELEADYIDKGSLAFIGNATVAQMVPAPTVPSTGTATMTARFDNNSKVFNFFLKWNNLAGLMTQANFYFPSDAVQTGVVARNIATTQTRPVTDSLYGQIWGNNTLTEQELSDLKAGKVYFTIGTQSNTGGEVRGQLLLQP